jgi:small-conductance mechanosensitive channel
VGGEIPMTGAAVVTLTTSDVVSITLRSWLVTGWARAHGGQVYRAPNDFTNSSCRNCVT